MTAHEKAAIEARGISLGMLRDLLTQYVLAIQTKWDAETHIEASLKIEIDDNAVRNLAEGIAVTAPPVTDEELEAFVHVLYPYLFPSKRHGSLTRSRRSRKTPCASSRRNSRPTPTKKKPRRS